MCFKIGSLSSGNTVKHMGGFLPVLFRFTLPGPIIMCIYYITVFADLKEKNCFNTLKWQCKGENEFLRETIFTCISGAQIGWINEIKKML